MPPEETAVAEPTDAFARALADERLQNGRRLCWLRFIGVSGFLVLTAVLGAVGDPRWHADLGLLAVYWAIAAALLIWQSRSARHRLNGFDIALVDMPLAFLIQWSLFVGGPNDRGTAGFSIGLYVLLVATSALALDVRSIALAAAVGAGLEMALQAAAGVSVGARIATGIVLAL